MKDDRKKRPALSRPVRALPERTPSRRTPAERDAIVLRRTRRRFICYERFVPWTFLRCRESGERVEEHA